MGKVAWFSCGATSAITCYLALKEDSDTEIIHRLNTILNEAE